MEGTRYNMHPKSYWGVSLLLEMVREAFKDPEVEAEFQAWLAQRNAQENQGKQEDSDGNQKD